MIENQEMIERKSICHIRATLVNDVFTFSFLSASLEGLNNTSNMQIRTMFSFCLPHAYSDRIIDEDEEKQYHIIFQGMVQIFKF